MRSNLRYEGRIQIVGRRAICRRCETDVGREDNRLKQGNHVRSACWQGILPPNPSYPPAAAVQPIHQVNQVADQQIQPPLPNEQFDDMLNVQFAAEEDVKRLILDFDVENETVRLIPAAPPIGGNMLQQNPGGMGVTNEYAVIVEDGNPIEGEASGGGNALAGVGDLVEALAGQWDLSCKECHAIVPVALRNSHKCQLQLED